MMPTRVVYHVFPAENRWLLRSEALGETWRFFATREEALAAARQLLEYEEFSEVVFHHDDGSVAERKVLEAR